MQTIEELMIPIERLPYHYDSLKSQFEEFTQLLNRITRFGSEILITDDHKNNRATINFLNKEIHILFNVIYQEDLTPIGQINCFLKNEFPDDGFSCFDSFTFNVDGITSHEATERNEKLKISFGQHVSLIALNIIKQALIHK